MKQFRFKTLLSLCALISVLFAASVTEAAAQQNGTAAKRTVTGKVVDQNGDPVIGAMVLLSGTKTGAATDLNGAYSIDIRKNGAVLEFSSIGYETTLVSLNDNQVKADVVMPTETM